MASTIQNVALAGATGNLGEPILKALLSSGNFNVTALTREGSNSTFPPNVTVARVDYGSISNLTEALKGQDAFISTVGTAGVGQQQKLVDAALAAGVKRFIPSEFGCDTTNPNSANLPVYKAKVEMQQCLEDKCKGSCMTYTLVLNNAFLDWGIKVGFLIDLKEKKMTRYDGGERRFSTTLLSTIAQGVVGVLNHPEETANTAVRIHDLILTQNKMLAMAKKAVGGQGWTVDDKTTVENEEEAYKMLQNGEGESRGPAMIKFLMSGVFREGYGGAFEQNDNTLLGIEGMSEHQVEELMKKIASEI